MDKTDSLPISEKELKHETDIEEEIIKDGTGYGDLMSTNIIEENVTRDTETYVGAPAPQNNEVYIQEHRKHFRMNQPDLNKLKYTKIGDEINFFDNGVHGTGIVSKMSSQYITIFKDDGRFYDVHINDTFFIKDILVNKTWNDMDMAERTLELQKARAYSPRFLNKAWNELPIELRNVLKSGQEKGTYGNVGGSPNLGISTQFDIDADKDYEGQSHSDINEQFKHEKNKPNTSNEGHDKKKDDGTATTNKPIKCKDCGINYSSAWSGCPNCVANRDRQKDGGTSTSTTGAFNPVYNKEEEADKLKAEDDEITQLSKDYDFQDDEDYNRARRDHYINEDKKSRKGDAAGSKGDDVGSKGDAVRSKRDPIHDPVREGHGSRGNRKIPPIRVSNHRGAFESSGDDYISDLGHKIRPKVYEKPRFGEAGLAPKADYMGTMTTPDAVKYKNHIGVPNKNNNTFGLRYSVKNIKDKEGD